MGEALAPWVGESMDDDAKCDVDLSFCHHEVGEFGWEFKFLDHVPGDGFNACLAGVFVVKGVDVNLLIVACVFWWLLRCNELFFREFICPCFGKLFDVLRGFE